MFSFIVLFLPYLSTAFIPTDSLPAFLQGFAKYQPVTLVIESFRSLTLGARDARAITGSIIWLVGQGIIATGLTSWFFRRAARR